MLRKAIYPKVEGKLNSIARQLHQKGITPNQLTFAGLAITFVAGWIYASGHFFWGAIVLLLGSFGDLLDGPLARLTGKTSKFGAFLDSTVDRYADFFIFTGLALHFSRQNQTGPFLLALGILLGAYVTSYAKARAENLIESCSVGIFERPERILTIALGSLIPPLIYLSLWILFLGTNVTAIHRILYTRKVLSENSSDQ